MPLVKDLFKMHQLPLKQGELYFEPHFLTQPQQFDLYLELTKTLNWSQDKIVIYGKQCLIPRLQAWYGDKEAEYKYSGILMQPMPWTDTLLKLKQQVEAACNCRFNSVLANFYRDGLDKMGYHADNEKELGERPTIASLNLGVTRKFVLKHNTSDEKHELTLTGGSLLVMAGDTQTYYKHAVPQQKKVHDGRINLTFRWISACH